MDPQKGFDFEYHAVPHLNKIMRNIQRNVMNAIKMNRLALLEIVKANKEKHIAEFIEAIADYKVVVLQLAQANLKLTKTGDLEQIKKVKGQPSAPISYETHYARSIRMLELSVEEIIEVEEDVFNQLVLDEWSWKHSFSASNTLYKSVATGASAF